MAAREKNTVKMICYVDIEHERFLASPDTRHSHLSWCMDVKLKLEEISGFPCIVQRYRDVSYQRLRDLGVAAVVISGNAAGFEEYEENAFVELQEIIRQADWPIIGFCGGLQLIAMAHGAPVAPMRRLRPGEPESTTLSGPGYLKEWGFMPVDVVEADPIFDGLGPSPVFLEAHYCEVRQLPLGFEALASSHDCRIQVMKQFDKLVYGTQFHPEGYTEGPRDRRSSLVDLVYPGGYPEARPAGRGLLANFFRIAGITE
jgi:GMP synthase-like glutamine amidotransferase